MKKHINADDLTFESTNEEIIDAILWAMQGNFRDELRDVDKAFSAAVKAAESGADRDTMDDLRTAFNIAEGEMVDRFIKIGYSIGKRLQI